MLSSFAVCFRNTGTNSKEFGILNSPNGDSPACIELLQEFTKYSCVKEIEKSKMTVALSHQNKPAQYLQLDLNSDLNLTDWQEFSVWSYSSLKMQLYDPEKKKMCLTNKKRCCKQHKS